MSLVADEEIGLGQKRDWPGDSAGGDSPGGPEVSESEKEKKRRLMTGDSEPDEYRAASSRPKSSVIRKWEGIDLMVDEEIFASKKRTLRSDVAKQREKADAAKKKITEKGQEIQVQKKRSSWSDAGKKTEDANIRAKEVAEEAVLRADQDGNNSVISESNFTKLLKCEEDITNHEKGSDTNKMNAEEDAGTYKKKVIGETDSSKKKAIEDVAPGEVTGDSCGIPERNGLEQMKCEQGIKFGTKGITSSDAATQSEEAQYASTDKVVVNEDAAPGADQQEKNLAIIEMNDTEQLKSGEDSKFKKNKSLGVANQREEAKAEDIRVEKKRITRSCAAKERKEVDTDMKKVTDASDCDMKNATEEASLGTGQNGKFSASKSNNAELIKYEGESKIKKKRITRPVDGKHREEVETVQKEAMEPELVGKRSREASDVETTNKKLKVGSLSCRQDLTRQKNCVSEKKRKPDIKKTSRLECEKNRRTKCSDRRTLRRFKDNGAHLGGVKREEFGITCKKSTRVLGRGGGVRRKAEENRKCLRPSSSANKGAPLCPSSHEEGKSLKILSSSVSPGKCQLSVDKASSPENNHSHEGKTGSELNHMDSSKDKSEIMVKGESNSTSKTPLPSKQRKGAARIEPRIAKQKLRDQIKEILLNAGWKIDLRPRAGKSYNDSVYISPKGPGYWSITKAYLVFQSQMNHAHVVKGRSLLGKSSKKSKGSEHNLEGTSSPFSAVPVEALSILKKVVVNRRRSKEEMEEAKKKLEDGSKSKKTKGSTGVDHRKNRRFKGNGREVKERKKKINSVGSSSKGIVGYTRQKPHNGKYGEKRRGMALLVRSSNQETATGTDVHAPCLRTRTIFSWMMDLGILPASCRVKYMNQNRTQTMLEGWITRNGIHCSCCSRILAVSNFEIHAGSKRCQPYRNIYLVEAGISLLQCQLNAWEKQDESVRQSFYSIDIDGDDPNDDSCGICGDGGDLICCDGCPSTFHLSCLDIQMLPPGDWHCMNCSCRFCGLVSGADSEDNGLPVSQLLSCSQCEEKYHQKCVSEGDAIPICSNFPCLPFCGQSCKKVFEQLRGLLGVKNDLEAGFSWTLLQRLDEDLPESVCGLDQRAECNSKVAVALAVMDECFLPIIDQRSGIDLIHNVVYNCGSNFSRLNYHGFYTFILERDGEVFSAASLRIHGTRLAEMPFIGTRSMYRRQGMCRRLLNGIESALCSLNIEKLVIPAISELRDTWINVFGFKPLEVSQKQEIRSINMVVFPGTGLLSKPLLKEGSTEHCKTADGVDKIETSSKYHHTHEVANESVVCSFVRLESDASAETFTLCEHEVKDREPGSEVSPKASDASHGSVPQTSEYKSSDIAVNEGLLLQPKVVYQAEPEVGNKFQADSRDAFASTLRDSGGKIAPLLPAVDGALLPDHYEVQCTSQAESSDASHGPEPQASEYKSSDIAANDDLLLHSEVDYHDEPVVGNKCHPDSVLVSEIEVPSEGRVHNNSNAVIRGACAVRNLVLDDNSAQHISDSKCTSLDASASTLPDSGGKTAPILLSIDGTLLPVHYEVQCASKAESSDASHGSEPQASEDKSSDIVANEDFLLRPEVVYQNEPLVGSKFQADSFLVSEIKMASDGKVHDNVDATTTACVVRNLLVVDDTSVQRTSDRKCTSPDACASTLLDSGMKTAPILHAVDGTSLPDHFEVQCESSEFSHGSEPRVSDYNSSDIAANDVLLLHSEVVYHDEPVLGNKFQPDSVLVSEIELPSEGRVHDNRNTTIRSDSVVRNLLVVDDTSAQHTSDSKCTSQDSSASTLRDSGGKTAPILPSIDGSLLPDHYVVQCTSPDAIPFSPQDSGGNVIHFPVSSLGLSSDETHHCRSEVTVISSVPFPGNGFQKYNERIVVDNHSKKHQVATIQPNFSEDLGILNSEIVVGPLAADANKFLTTSVETNIHAVGENTVHTVRELKGHLAVIRPKPFADGGDAEQFSSETIKTPPDFAAGREIQDLCVISASHDTDNISVHAPSEYYDEGPSQHNSEQQQKPTRKSS